MLQRALSRSLAGGCLTLSVLTLAACGGGGTPGTPAGTTPTNPQGTDPSGGQSGTGTGTGTGQSGTGTTTGTGQSSPTSPVGTTTLPTPTALPLLNVTACLPSGQGRDFQVGPGAGQLASLALVPWATLAAGDTVRIFYSATPYRGKFLIAASGTATAPVRVCGVKNASGQRPIIDGQNAVTRAGLDYGDSTSTAYLHQTRSVIVVKKLGAQPWQAFPSYIQIDGLEVRGAKPGNTFTDAAGVVRPYVEFGACIWLDRGQNITVADNVIHDCNQGVYSKSTDDGDFAVTRNIRLAGNYIYGNGIVGKETLHNTYMASSNIVYEFNRYGPLRAGAGGNAIKDRSVGTVVRYNRIEEGAHAIDLVEAEDFPIYALAQAAYRTTLVYGNQIIKSSGTGSTIHYGGDHFGSAPGAHWGEPFFRQGTLYFYNNTVRLTATSGTGQLFQVSTTLERVEAWNNVFVFDAGITYPALRANQDVNTAYWTPGGIVNLGRNWISARWADSDPYHTVPGQVLGQANMVAGPAAPVDPATLVPLAGSAVIDAAQTAFSSAVAAALAAHPVAYQLDTQFNPRARTVLGAGVDLGAIER